MSRWERDAPRYLSAVLFVLRKWYQENGKENILRWLNEELEEK